MLSASTFYNVREDDYARTLFATVQCVPAYLPRGPKEQCFPRGITHLLTRLAKPEPQGCVLYEVPLA